jgi:16S rRNA processing protein RimM
MIRREEVYKIGKIGKPHGVKGEMTFMFDDDVFDRVDADYLVLDVDGILVPFFITDYRFRTDETALILFDGIETQEQARALTNTDVYFPRALSDNDAPHLSWDDFIGYTINNHPSPITHIDTTTENVLFELENGALIPAADDLIVDINNEEKTITMNIPEGLFDI